MLVVLAAPAWADTKACEDAYERKDYEAALKECRPLAERGHASAQYTLGNMYHWGMGVPQDNAEAVRRYRKAAEQGNASAQFNLALMYDKGQGVPQDYGQAVRWYRKAAEQGEASAQFAFGLMYGTGQGVPQDYIQAHNWLNLAASRAETGEVRDEAAKNRDFVAKLMTPAQIAEAQQLATKWKPREQSGAAPDN